MAASKKTYELIAREIRTLMLQATRSRIPYGQRKSVDYFEGVIEAAQVVAIALAEDNEAFDKDRFLTAAGVTF